MKKKIVLVFSLLICVLLSGCCLSHEWQAASCAAPKTCVKCQKTAGEPLEHTWMDATCDAAKTCKVCGTTEGEPLGHTPGEWEQISLDPITLERERVKHCTVCEELVEEETEILTTLHEDGKFLLTLRQFHERLSYMVEKVVQEKRPGDEMKVLLVEEAAATEEDKADAVLETYTVINAVDLELYAKLYLSGEDDALNYDDGNACPTELHTVVYRHNSPLSDTFCMILMMVIDPTVTDVDTSMNILNQEKDSEGMVTHNNIQYKAALLKDYGVRLMDVYIAKEAPDAVDAVPQEFDAEEIDKLLQGTWIYRDDVNALTEYIEIINGELLYKMVLDAAPEKASMSHGHYTVYDGYISTYFEDTDYTNITNYTWVDGELVMYMESDSGVDKGTTRYYTKVSE